MAGRQALRSDLASDDERRAAAAAEALAAQGAAALPTLLDLLNDPNEDVRWWAARLLADIEAPSAEAALLGALEDGAPAVRQCAALALRGRSAPPTLAGLARALADADALVARLAGGALEAAGRAATPLLLAVLREGPPRARIEAARALAGVRDESTAEALSEALLEDASQFVAYWAEEGLERLGPGMLYFRP